MFKKYLEFRYFLNLEKLEQFHIIYTHVKMALDFGLSSEM